MARRTREVIEPADRPLPQDKDKATGWALIEALQACPYPDVAFEGSRIALPVREAALEF
ncbi:hypothetical protein [Nitrospirillum viridazoti]|uniref:Uncharacterized protein n=1 Tax=Nitrospirillum amazonense TaxID=28077 RepID=A0A560IYY7_9PROT|nr:hypothetical protein [Nitrospirillum amazonense]TWB63695.1 hypothetical protein FBZ92_103186 [Nitrospirillum amazonense]